MQRISHSTAHAFTVLLLRVIINDIRDVKLADINKVLVPLVTHYHVAVPLML